MSEPQFEHVAILGLGLIGSSIARGLHEYKAAAHITAFDRNPLALQFGLERGFIDSGAENAGAAVKEADVIILATPPSALGATAESIRKGLKPHAVLTDTSSVKQPAIEAILPFLPRDTAFVPGHPIAGSEQSGVKAGRADLFAGKRVILTPSSPENSGISSITKLWQALGATVEYMPPDIHDRVYAYVSHLPQWLAFALKNVLENHLQLREKYPVFKRFTRLCFSDTHLWDDIFSANMGYLEQALARYLVVLEHIRGELVSGAEGTESELSEEVYTIVLPAIAASCLIATVTQEERDSGFSFARYAGPGFQDFTAPMHEHPEKTLEFISNHAGAAVKAIDAFLVALTQAIVTKD